MLPLESTDEEYIIQHHGIKLTNPRNRRSHVSGSQDSGSDLPTKAVDVSSSYLNLAKLVETLLVRQMVFLFKDSRSYLACTVIHLFVILLILNDILRIKRRL